MTHLRHVTRDEYMCGVTHSHAWHDSFLFYDILWNGMSIRVVSLVHIRNMTHLYFEHESFTCVWMSSCWTQGGPGMMSIRLWHDSIMCENTSCVYADMYIYIYIYVCVCVYVRIENMFDMTDLCVRHASCMYANMYIHIYVYMCVCIHVWSICLTWLIYVRDMPHVCMKICIYIHIYMCVCMRILLIWVMHWEEYMCDMTDSYVRHVSFMNVYIYDLFLCKAWFVYVCMYTCIYTCTHK